jgi:Flp pilus assembly protein TadD
MLKTKDTSVAALALLVAITPPSSALAASPFSMPGGLMAQDSRADSSSLLQSSVLARTSVTDSMTDNFQLVSDLGGSRVAQETAIASANSADAANDADAGIPVWLWWLLPLALLGLLWWLLRKRAESNRVESSQAASVSPVSPAPRASRAVTSGVATSTSPTDTHSARAGATAPSSATNAVPSVGSTLVGGAAAAARSSLSSDRPNAIPEYQALYNRGMVLAESGLYEEAIASFDRAIDVKPDFFAAWASKGDALLSVDRPEEAIVSFDRAIELSTTSTSDSAIGTALAATWAGKGNALANLGRAEEAIVSFDQALEIEPTYAEAQASRNALIASLNTAALFSLTQADSSLGSVPSLAAADPGNLAEMPPLVEGPAANTTLDNPTEDIPAEDTPAEDILAEDIPKIRTQIGGAVLAAGTDAWSAMSSDRIQIDKIQSDVEAAKFNVGQTDEVESLAAVDEDLDDLPEGYGESRIVLMPRDPQWAYAYWDIPVEHKEELRQQGGSYLALRLYDVTDIDLNHQNSHSLQQFSCEEMARDWYLPIPVSDRDYIVEIGYLTNNSGWLMLARSAPTRIPPAYPSDWFEDQFLTLSWDEDLRDKTFLALTPPTKQGELTSESTPYNTLFGLAQSAESMRVAGSLFGSMQQVPQQAISSYIFPSGAALWSMPTSSGIGMSGIGMSGAGFPASIPPIRPRQFWLVADAELIVYGATEPDATVTIDGQPIQLNPDGTFRFQMSFQDGIINYPIIAVAVDGEQSRSIHMEFERETPERNTNTRDEATDEWLE